MRRKWNRWWTWCCAAPAAYVACYFLLGSHTTGYDMKWATGTGKTYYWHDRSFPFDPWIYRPLARLEQAIRGGRSQVVIDYNGFQGGQPKYIYGPYITE